MCENTLVLVALSDKWLQINPYACSSIYTSSNGALGIMCLGTRCPRQNKIYILLPALTPWSLWCVDVTRHEHFDSSAVFSSKDCHNYWPTTRRRHVLHHRHVLIVEGISAPEGPPNICGTARQYGNVPSKDLREKIGFGTAHLCYPETVA